MQLTKNNKHIYICFYQNLYVRLVFILRDICLLKVNVDVTYLL